MSHLSYMVVLPFCAAVILLCGAAAAWALPQDRKE